MTISEALVLEPSSNSWWIDSAATRHIVQNKDMFMKFTEKKVGEHRIYMGNNSYSDVLGIGNCQFSIKGTSIVLHDVLYVPNIRRNLISVPVLTQKGFEVNFRFNTVLIKKGSVLVKGVRVNDMYSLPIDNKAHVLIPKPLRDKLGSKTWECKFIGYVENESGYRFYHPERGLIESRDAIFIESIDLVTLIEQIELLSEVSQDSSLPSLSHSPHVLLEPSNSGHKHTLHDVVLPASNSEISGSKRARRPSTVLKDHYVFQVEELNNLVDDPTSYNEAMSNSDAPQWLESMNEELDSIKKNDVWELTDLPNGRKAIVWRNTRPG
ncbi:hypothetical protein CsSME_00040528 [Camellia sinensis var. sinensis]